MLIMEDHQENLDFVLNRYQLEVLSGEMILPTQMGEILVLPEVIAGSPASRTIANSAKAVAAEVIVQLLQIGKSLPSL